MVNLTLEEWDAKIGPHLASIRLNAGWIEAYAKKIIEHVDALDHYPAWDTEAMEVAKKARDELATATFLLNEAINVMATKPKAV